MKLFLFSAAFAFVLCLPAAAGTITGTVPSLWSVCVSTAAQRAYVYKENELERILICSTGARGTGDATPEGEYVLNENGSARGVRFYSSRYGEKARYWVGFVEGTYVFRSIAVDSDGNAIPAEQEKLGRPFSHGSICLSVQNARWFYTNIPDGTRICICREWHPEQTGVNEGVQTKDDVSLFLASHMKAYRQKYTLSCEAAMTRLSLALMGVQNLSEDAILDVMPQNGSDPERYFVCDDITAGRKNRDGTIHWNNYGTHPPVVVTALESFMHTYHTDGSWSARELRADDKQLRLLIHDDSSFRGAILWLVGHPDRWGAHPAVNGRGMVLGEHVRFLEPVLDPDGRFRIRDPETGVLIESEDTGAGRELFSYRIVALFRS
jgi:hypothetical protein